MYYTWEKKSITLMDKFKFITHVCVIEELFLCHEELSSPNNCKLPATHLCGYSRATILMKRVEI